MRRILEQKSSLPLVVLALIHQFCKSVVLFMDAELLMTQTSSGADICTYEWILTASWMTSLLAEIKLCCCCLRD